jgi:predicted dehydrogenase
MKELRVGMIGYAFMGKAHSQAWRNAPRFFDLPLRPSLAVLCGRSSGPLRDAAAAYGFADTETDWQRLIARDDVDVIDICVPGDAHAAIAVAALEAGKHVLCEKPLANTVAEAERMTEAAGRAAGRSMVVFNYRRVPALALARRLIASGRLGTLHQVRAQYLQDWNRAFRWRRDRRVRGDQVRDRAEERDAHRGQRLARQPGLRSGGAQRAVPLRSRGRA